MKDKIVVNSDLSNNINIQNAFAELTNDNHFLENSLYWLNIYIEDCECKDDKIITIRNLLLSSKANIKEAFLRLDKIVSR